MSAARSPARQNAYAVGISTMRTVSREARLLLLNPTAGTNAEVEATAQGMQALLDAAWALIVHGSTSSAVHYVEQDMDSDDRTALLEARHALAVLTTIYATNVAASS